MRWEWLLAGMLTAFPVAAQDMADLRRCIAVVDDKDRLSCFDGAMSPKEHVAPGAGIGLWKLSESVDSLDGSKRLAAVVTATGANAGKAAIIIRCIKGSIDVLVFWPDYLGYKEPVPARWRVDGGMIRADTWRLVDGGRGVYVDPPRLFVERIVGGREAVINLTPKDRLDQSIAFPIEGVGDAIKPLLAACKN